MPSPPNVWTDLGSADYGVGAPLDDALFDALTANDGAGADHVFQVQFDQVSAGGTAYVTVHTVEYVVGPRATSIAILVHSLALIGAGPGSGFIKCTIAGTLDSDQVAVTGTATPRTNTIADVTAYRGQRVTIEIKVKSTLASGELVYVYSLNQASCVERSDLSFTSLAGLSLNRSKFLDFESRDEDGIDHAFPIRLEQISNTGPAYPTFSSALATRRLIVPSNAKQLRVWLQAYVDAGTGHIRGELGPTPIVSSDLQVTATAPWTWYELVFADVRALRGEDVGLVFKLANSGGGNSTIARDGDPGNFLGYGLIARFTA